MTVSPLAPPDYTLASLISSSFVSMNVPDHFSSQDLVSATCPPHQSVRSHPCSYGLTIASRRATEVADEVWGSTEAGFEGGERGEGREGRKEEGGRSSSLSPFPFVLATLPIQDIQAHTDDARACFYDEHAPSRQERSWIYRRNGGKGRVPACCRAETSFSLLPYLSPAPALKLNETSLERIRSLLLSFIVYFQTA